MSLVKVSFVVPVYNTEEYLRECLDSIVNQAIDSQEIILVNDGSTDGSLKICEEYAQKYDYIKIITKENGGLSSARNCGIREAEGEYIQFVDSDDFLDINYADKLYGVVKENNYPDMVFGKYCLFFQDSGLRLENPISKKYKRINELMSAKEYFIECIRYGKYEVTAVVGLFKREFLLKNNISFTEGVHMEDHEFTLKCLTCDENANVIYLDYGFYTYRKRQNSITTTPKLKNIQDITKNVKFMYDYIEESLSDEETIRYAKKAVSALFYQLTSVYGRLDSNLKERAYKMVDRKYKNELITYAINKHQKAKIILFFYFRWIVDLVYKVKRR